MYTWKMRNSEPDSKYFGESHGNLRLPCQNIEKPPENCAKYLLCGFLRNWRSRDADFSTLKISRQNFNIKYLSDFVMDFQFF
jgi:hypothetical protein